LGFVVPFLVRVVVVVVSVLQGVLVVELQVQRRPASPLRQPWASAASSVAQMCLQTCKFSSQDGQVHQAVMPCFSRERVTS
jgi:hypothetical protein